MRDPPPVSFLGTRSLGVPLWVGCAARARVGAWDVRSLVAMSPRGDRGGWWWRFGEERRFRPLARSGSGPRVVRDRIHGRLDASLAPDGPRPGRTNPRRPDVRRDPRRTYRRRSRGGDALPPSRPTPSPRDRRAIRRPRPSRRHPDRSVVSGRRSRHLPSPSRGAAPTASSPPRFPRRRVDRHGRRRRTRVRVAPRTPTRTRTQRNAPPSPTTTRHPRKQTIPAIIAPRARPRR